MSDISETFTKGNLHDLVELLIVPSRCGFFLTRNRIREIGVEMSLRTGIQTRKRMLENLFREAGSENKIYELLGFLDSDAKFWLERYSFFTKSFIKFLPIKPDAPKTATDLFLLFFLIIYSILKTK